ncbi:hypothetical protein KY285_032303 [Solanum tuberosum]|nr:hypothetical protein KY285_032303 [Solanum tuberosum]
MMFYFQFIIFGGAIFVLPQSVSKEVDPEVSDFIWGGKDDQRKIHLVAWDRVCKPKCNGGLNVQGYTTYPPRGDYSISKSYLAILGSQVNVDFANLIWNGVAQPKHRFIVWLATKDRLLTKERLTKLHIPVDDLQCCLCNSNDEETTKHLFDECAWFQTIREDMMQWTGIRLQHGSSKQVLLEIRRKHWKAIQKEIIAAVWGAMIHGGLVIGNCLRDELYIQTVSSSR